MLTSQYVKSPTTLLRMNMTAQAMAMAPVTDTIATVNEKLAAADLTHGARAGRGVGAGGRPSPGQRKYLRNDQPKIVTLVSTVARQATIQQPQTMRSVRAS